MTQRGAYFSSSQKQKRILLKTIVSGWSFNRLELELKIIGLNELMK